MTHRQRVNHMNRGLGVLFQGVWSCLVSLMMVSMLHADPERIRMLTYHNHPPFVVGPGQGLSFDLASLLTQYAKGQPLFQVQIVPRSRLNFVLKDWIQDRCTSPEIPCPEDWIVPWVHPTWGFGERPDERFQWMPILEDSNAILSHARHPIAYHGPDSLMGLRFGGIRGHVYLGVDALVKDKKIMRIDGHSERDNLLKLIKKRVDVLLLPTSTVHYFFSQDSELARFKKDVHMASTKHQIFLRHLMLPLKRSDLAHLLSPLGSDPAWQDILKRYGFKQTPS